MKRTLATKLIATCAIAAMVTSPVLAASADSLRDLVGVRGSSGETELQARGFQFAKAGGDSGNTRITYWWNESRKDCVKVATFDGRYTAITDASSGDCGKGSGSGTAVAVAAIGAVALGALLLSRKDRNKKNDSGYQQDWQQVEVYNLQSGTLRIFASPDKNARVRDEVGSGTLLRNYGCEDYGGESWCEVSTINYRTRGWARDRYLRPSYGSGYPGDGYPGGGYPGGPGGGYPGGPGNGSGDMVQVYGVSSALTISSTPGRGGYVVGRVNNGARLRKMDCQYSNSEQWCRVATIDWRMQGWARERYLRSTY